ncbi:MAG TPA: glutathione-disulfide reductase [Alphaproteobacteria bacterium]|nr:glutathione-disulfide reductase [Alphaproteobacteria bacterium]
MAKCDYDLFVIGGGSGGVRAARMSARYGARVGLAEERYLGGTCVNVGCIPKKLFVYASHYSEHFEGAAGFGWTVGEPHFDWPTLIRHKNAEIARLNGVYRALLEDAGVEILSARAVLRDAHTVEVAGRRASAERILVSTGGWPVLPKLPGVEHAISSNEAFFLPQLPERVVIVGGGYIACEFAGIFRGMGSRVVQLYRGPLFLRGFDGDVRKTLAEEMRKKGIELRFNVEIAGIEKTRAGLVALLTTGERLEGDLVLFATGRAPNTKGLGLESAGVALNARGAVEVDAYSRSSVANIYAVGDVTDRINLTPVAIAEGQAFADTIYNDNPTRADHANVPSAVFSQPELATVGLTEEAAREAFGAIAVYRTSFRPLKHTLSGRSERTMMKLVVECLGDKVVGVHMVGEGAAEIVQGLAVAVKAGATKRDFDRTIGIHPTAAEEFVTMRTPLSEPEKQAAE